MSKPPKKWSKAELVAELDSNGFLSLNKAAMLINVSYPTILKMRNSGKLQTVLVGGIFRVYRPVIRQLLGLGGGDSEEGVIPSSNHLTIDPLDLTRE